MTTLMGLACPAPNTAGNAPAGGPVAIAGVNQTVAAGVRVALYGQDSYDPGGRPLTFLWEQTSGAPVALEMATTSQARFLAPRPTAPVTLLFQLTVSNGSASNTSSTAVTVHPDSCGSSLAASAASASGDSTTSTGTGTPSGISPEGTSHAASVVGSSLASGTARSSSSPGSAAHSGGGTSSSAAAGQVWVSDCLARAQKNVVTGAAASFRDAIPNGSTLDARTARWQMNDGWLVTPASGADVCWLGGVAELTFDDTALTPMAAWADVWHHNGGFTTKTANSNWIIDSVTVRHVGDAFNLSDGTTNFTIRHSHIMDVRDDCVQNDYMNGGRVQANFFDGCYVGFSARASGAAPDGHLNTWIIEDNLVWIRPTYSVYKGDSPGNGQIVKWEKVTPQNAPHLVFRNNMVRVGKTPFQVGANAAEDFFFPPDGEFSNNTLVWDGAGAPPSSLTQWFNAAHGSRVGTLGDWNSAVDLWSSQHPGF